MSSLVWDEDALTDLQAIGDYISADSPSAARRVLDYIVANAERLRGLPLLGRTTSEPDVYELVLFRFPYILVYVITDEEIHIVAVVHYRQQRR